MKQNLRFFLTILGALLVMSGSALPGLALAAKTARLYASPAQATASQGKNISVPIRIDPANNDIDTVNVTVHFPSEQLSLVDVDKAGSTFDTFVPGSPHTANGYVEFSAAGLGKTVDDDSLVATLVFTAKASSGSATIDLTGAQAARKGTTVPITSGNTVVSFTSKDGSVSNVGITNVHVDDVTVNGATLRWKTTQPATSNVVYGPTEQYGFSAGSDTLVTDHIVKLAPVFGGNTRVHFLLTSRDGNGASSNTDDRMFTTTGYTVSIKVTDKSGRIISGATVKVGNVSTAKTNSNGVAKLTNVAAGNQKVVVNGGKTQFISVKSVNGVKAATVQQFNLTAEPRPLLPRLVLAGAAILLVAVLIYWLLRERSSKNATV